ncbi:MAG: ATP-binding protein, partial [Bacteroidota bacterium]|nr:ATP-binding protein [Bacteroidota bacterium]
MTKEVLKSVIISQKEKFLSKSELINRAILDKEKKKILAREVVFITGVRRSGKSSLLYLIYKYLSKLNKIPVSNILFINFEDERFINFTVADFDSLYRSFLEIENPKGKKYLFFDEIQNIKGWERWINRLYEFEDTKIFITGSNASLINSDISTSLTGRNRQIQNYTFSLLEYAKLKKIEVSLKTLLSDNKRLGINRLLNKYFDIGGFPEALKSGDTEIVDQYFKDIIYRDIIAKYSIRNIKEIKELALYLISNTGNINSYENLRKIINASNASTIKNYISVFQDVFLIYALPLFNYSIKKQIYNPNKYYASDIGFYHAVGFSFSADNGRLLENLVLFDLLRNEYEVFYWKSKKAFEVDFVVHFKKKISHAIQVCF